MSSESKSTSVFGISWDTSQSRLASLGVIDHSLIPDGQDFYLATT
jgi:hypothetical protein